MPAKVWIGHRALNLVLDVVLALLAGCECQHTTMPDAGIDAGEIVDAAVFDAGTDAGTDAGPQCVVVSGPWRFVGTGAPVACGMFEFVAELETFADARGSRECTTGCSCASSVPVEPTCEVAWSETCGATRVDCVFTRVDESNITGRCDDGSCGVDWQARPIPAP